MEVSAIMNIHELTAGKRTNTRINPPMDKEEGFKKKTADKVNFGANKCDRLIVRANTKLQEAEIQEKTQIDDPAYGNQVDLRT